MRRLLALGLVALALAAGVFSCPANRAGAIADNDGDGYTEAAEEAIFSFTPGSLLDAERCGPNNWPSDLDSTGTSANKVTVLDISSFIAPVRRLDSSPGDPEFSPRWDLSPGTGGVLTDWINIIDLTALYSGSYPSTGYPPMFGGLKALGGPACTSSLFGLLQDVPLATAYRYGTKDNQNSSMDTLKVITDPSGGYLGVYHTLSSGVFSAKVATSADLLNWTFAANLDTYASQPTITVTSDGGFVVAYEKGSGGAVQCTGGNECLVLRYYPTRAALLTGAWTREIKLPRTFSNCAEGTPNIYSAVLSPDIDHSVLDVGFHYFRDCDVDRQARGTLTNFTSWSASVETATNNLFEAWPPPLLGNVGDRDPFLWDGAQRRVHEAQYVKGDWASWRVFLHGAGGISELSIQTHGGSVSFGNPAVTAITSPGGKPALLVTYFVFSQGAAPGEGGELVFYREF